MSSIPREPVNDEAVEFLWANKAVAYVETHYKLIKTIKDKSKLRLTKIDDEIYKHFREAFPTMRVDVFDEDASKSPAGKEAWRKFIAKYDDSTVKDFNMGTLMRGDVSKGLDQDNLILVIRLQFFAIEIARNKEGFNNVVA